MVALPRGTRPCCRNGCEEPRASGHIYCHFHQAEYRREFSQDYYALAFREGVDACVRLLREQIGDRPTTGWRAAELLTHLTATETASFDGRRSRA